jgi:hypothetical protein
MQKDKERFEKWFVKPLRELEAIPGGAGAFIALATSCFLYERYVRAKVATETENRFDDKLDTHYRNLQLARDLNIDETTAAAFWKVMRNGLLHYGMPQRPRGTKEWPKWRFEHSYLQPVGLSQHANGEWWLEVQPWRFMDIVIDICQSNIDIIIGSEGFPWATIEEEDEE